MNLSKIVHKINDNELLNLTTKRLLPVDASEDELRENYFLKGQEVDAIEWTIFQKRVDFLVLRVTPTWNCNLRCKHCFVLDKLTIDQKSEIDVDKVMIFIKNFHKEYDIKKIYLTLIGGEVTLDVQKCLELTEKVINYCDENDLEHHFNLTTNGTIFNLSVLELFNRCKRVLFSLDGPREAHNWQRKAFTPELSGKDLYDVTVSTIKKVIALGLKEKVSVQAALQDKFFNSDVRKEFYENMVKIGVSPKMIHSGAVVPTSIVKIGESFTKGIETAFFNRPCCNYRVAENFTVDENNKLYMDYFGSVELSYLGELDDPIDKIINSQIALVKEKMEVLNDDKCLSCPVVGVCWGKCRSVSIHHKPSDICSPEKLMDKVIGHIKNSNLLKTLDSGYQGHS